MSENSVSRNNLESILNIRQHSDNNFIKPDRKEEIMMSNYGVEPEQVNVCKMNESANETGGCFSAQLQKGLNTVDIPDHNYKCESNDAEAESSNKTKQSVGLLLGTVIKQIMTEQQSKQPTQSTPASQKNISSHSEILPTAGTATTSTESPASVSDVLKSKQEMRESAFAGPRISSTSQSVRSVLGTVIKQILTAEPTNNGVASKITEPISPHANRNSRLPTVSKVANETMNCGNSVEGSSEGNFSLKEPTENTVLVKTGEANPSVTSDTVQARGVPANKLIVDVPKNITKFVNSNVDTKSSACSPSASSSPSVKEANVVNCFPIKLCPLSGQITHSTPNRTAQFFPISVLRKPVSTLAPTIPVALNSPFPAKPQPNQSTVLVPRALNCTIPAGSHIPSVQTGFKSVVTSNGQTGKPIVLTSLIPPSSKSDVDLKPPANSVSALGDSGTWTLVTPGDRTTTNSGVCGKSTENKPDLKLFNKKHEKHRSGGDVVPGEFKKTRECLNLFCRYFLKFLL